MRIFASVLLSLVWLVVPTLAAHREVQVEVLSTLSQTIRWDVGSSAGGQLDRAVPCSPVGAVEGYPGECAGPSAGATGSAQNRRVEAILTTEDGQTYYAVLDCQRQYGWCTPLANGQKYVGKLSDQAKWLADYQHRPVNGYMRVSLRPEGKHKVSYTISWATKVQVLKRAGDKP
jgi:hypothetical protein